MKFTRGVVTLTFDDGYERIFRDILPLLRRYNFPAVFAVPLDGTTLAEQTGHAIMPWRRWQTVTAEGHEIAAHSITHVDLTQGSVSEQDRELSQPAKTLGARTIVYPGGAHNSAVVAAAEKYYAAGRTVRAGFESLPPENPMRLKTFNYTRKNFNLHKANARALWACGANRWLIETFHIVEEVPSSEYSVPLGQFKKHLAFIARLPIAVQTIQQSISSSRGDTKTLNLEL